MEYFGFENLQVAEITLILETLMFVLIFIGWLYGSRRLNIFFHHRIVYPIVFINAVVIYFQMIAGGIRAIDFGLLLHPFEGTNWLRIGHMFLGVTTAILVFTLLIVFFLEPDLPLKILKRARPLMFATLIAWTMSFIVGCVLFIDKYSDQLF